MFKIDYKVINPEWMDFIGQNGFFKIHVNDKSYGDIWPDKLIEVMGPDDLDFWFQELVNTIISLDEINYYILSDMESYNTWLEFKRQNDQVIISVKRSEKSKGNRKEALKKGLIDPEDGEWVDEVVSYKQMYDEIKTKSIEYLEYLIDNNDSDEDFSYFRKNVEEHFLN